jgi:hypothetical protein
MIATPLKAIVDRKTVRYASAEACLYAVVPAARIFGLKPSTDEKLPVAYDVKNVATDDAGNPADTSADGTWAGMVVSSRFVNMTVYTATPIVLIVFRTLEEVSSLPKCCHRIELTIQPILQRFLFPSDHLLQYRPLQDPPSLCNREPNYQW